MPTFLPRKFVLKVVLSMGNWKPHIADSHPLLSTLNICNSNLLFFASKRNVMFTSLSFYTWEASFHISISSCALQKSKIYHTSHHLSRNQVNITCTDPSLKPSFLKTASMQETSVYRINLRSFWCQSWWENVNLLPASVRLRTPTSVWTMANTWTPGTET